MTHRAFESEPMAERQVAGTLNASVLPFSSLSRVMNLGHGVATEPVFYGGRSVCRLSEGSA